jgi:hypothetical protein
MQPKLNDLAHATSQRAVLPLVIRQEFGRAVHAPPAMSTVAD